MKIGIAFQPDLLAIMHTFSQFDAALKKRIATATEKSGPVIADSIVAHMPPWQNGTDTFNSSFGVEIIDEFSAFIGSPLAYGPRLNWGFQGPDSLGRVYSQDATLFMEATVNDDNTLLDVAENYIDAVYGAWNDCVGSLPPGQSAVMGIL